MSERGSKFEVPPERKVKKLEDIPTDAEYIIISDSHAQELETIFGKDHLFAYKWQVGARKFYYKLPVSMLSSELRGGMGEEIGKALEKNFIAQIEAVIDVIDLFPREIFKLIDDLEAKKLFFDEHTHRDFLNNLSRLISWIELKLDQLNYQILAASKLELQLDISGHDKVRNEFFSFMEDAGDLMKLVMSIAVNKKINNTQYEQVVELVSRMRGKLSTINAWKRDSDRGKPRFRD